MTESSSLPTRRLSRRALLKRAAATLSTVALMDAVRLAFPGGAHVAQAAGPEVKKATLGFIALTDAAPLFVAKEKGMFAKFGMPDVEIAKQASWGTTRDNLVLGSEGTASTRPSHADALPHLRRQGDAEQCADTDVHPGAAQPQRTVHLGRQGIHRHRGRGRHQADQDRAGKEEDIRQASQGRNDLSGRHA